MILSATLKAQVWKVRVYCDGIVILTCFASFKTVSSTRKIVKTVAGLARVRVLLWSEGMG